MKKANFLGSSAIGSAALEAMVLAAPAHAQAEQPVPNARQQAQPGSQPGDTPDTSRINPQSEVQVESGQAPEAAEQAITVTGSRIRRPNLTAPVPITSVTAQELPNQS